MTLNEAFRSLDRNIRAGPDGDPEIRLGEPPRRLAADVRQGGRERLQPLRDAGAHDAGRATPRRAARCRKSLLVYTLFLREGLQFSRG